MLAYTRGTVFGNFLPSDLVPALWPFSPIYGIGEEASEHSVDQRQFAILLNAVSPLPTLARATRTPSYRFLGRNRAWERRNGRTGGGNSLAAVPFRFFGSKFSFLSAPRSTLFPQGVPEDRPGRDMDMSDNRLLLSGLERAMFSSLIQITRCHAVSRGRFEPGRTAVMQELKDLYYAIQKHMRKRKVTGSQFPNSGTKFHLTTANQGARLDPSLSRCGGEGTRDNEVLPRLPHPV